jgi:septal ring factor EnvC (AmiA/AmiB activator)
MRAEEAELSEVVERLAEILARFPTNSEAPFAEQRGELPWPVEGTVLNGFGKPREGGGSWDGVLLEAPAGAPVRAVYNGRVVYADWLSTYGLVLILEHGDGYMTLYGHNGALLRDVGDWVAPGEAIAEVGNSGGQAGPGLYFGIFRDGAAIDPERWIR